MPYLCTLKSREKCLCLENDEMIFLNKHQTGNYLRMIFVKSLLDSILNQERWDWGGGEWEWGEILYKHEHFSPKKQILIQNGLQNPTKTFAKPPRQSYSDPTYIIIIASFSWGQWTWKNTHTHNIVDETNLRTRILPHMCSFKKMWRPRVTEKVI